MESCLHILREHVNDGDRWMRQQTQHLITLDQGFLASLTPLQRRAHDEQLAALRAGELRNLPTVFGDLS